MVFREQKEGRWKQTGRARGLSCVTYGGCHLRHPMWRRSLAGGQAGRQRQVCRNTAVTLLADASGRSTGSVGCLLAACSTERVGSQIRRRRAMEQLRRPSKTQSTGSRCDFPPADGRWAVVAARRVAVVRQRLCSQAGGRQVNTNASTPRELMLEEGQPHKLQHTVSAARHWLPTDAHAFNPLAHRLLRAA